MDGNLLNINLLESLTRFDGTTEERISQTTQIFNQICRTCLCGTTDNNLDNNLILTNKSNGQSVTIKEMLELSTGLKIDAKENLPNHICDRCLKAIEAAFAFRTHSERVEEILRSFLDQINNTENMVCPENKLLEPTDVAVPMKCEKIDEHGNTIQIEEFQVSFVEESMISSGTQSNMSITSAAEADCDAAGNKQKLFKCEICGKEYSYRNGLHNHMTISHTHKKEYTCLVCKRKYQQRSKFLNHKKRFCIDPSSIPNMGNPPPRVTVYPDPYDEDELLAEIKGFSCALCGGIFEEENEFNLHLAMQHVREKSCTYCGKKLKRPYDLETHIRGHSGERHFGCPICIKAFSSPRTLRCHLRMHSNKEGRKCNECRKEFSSIKDFLAHIKTCSPVHLDEIQPGVLIPSRNEEPSEPDDSNSEEHTEGFGKVSFDKEYKLEPEEVWVAEPVTAIKKEETTTNIGVEAVAWPQESQEISPKLDESEFKEPPDGFIITVKQETPDDDSSDESSSVYEPPVVAIKPETLEGGIPTPLPITNEPLSDDEPVFDQSEDPSQQLYSQEFGRFTCCIASCKVEFKYFRDILNHYASQHCVDSPPFNCPLCGELFSQKKDIRRHLRSHLSCEYKCPYCPKAYWQMRDLRIHLRTHTGERPFKCPQCPKRFKQRPALKVHINTHNDCKEYKCKICPKEFFSYNGLFLHTKGHMEIKELQCTNCGKQFPTPSRLRRHKNGACGIRGVWSKETVQTTKTDN